MLNKITEKIDEIKFELNLNTKYTYKVRSKECYIYNNVLLLDVFFDNHDFEVFTYFVIQNEKLDDKTKKEIFDFSNKIIETNKTFDMNEIDSIFENYILL